VEVRPKLRALWQSFFGDSVRAFGSASLLLLALMAMAVVKYQFSPWRVYQTKYLQLARGRADAQELQRHFQPGIQQIWLPDQGVVDRCTTCHVALRETGLKDVEQPFRPHPPVSHPLTEFGCVTCHRGQGAATTVKEGHGNTPGWDQPLLPVKYLEASCGQCHLAALPGTPRLNVGRVLMAQNGCVRCHLVKQPDGTTMSATDNPPSLVHIAEKTTREWIYSWVKDPQRYSAVATMPNFGLSDNDAEDIAAFLISQSTPSAVSTAVAALSTKVHGPEAQQAGERIYGEALCASCHAVHNTLQNLAGQLQKPHLGPDLTRIGSKVKSSWLEAWLSDPTTYNPATVMPRYRFNAQQAGLLTAYFEAKTDPNLLARVHLAAAAPQQIDRGQRQVMERGCASCHEINGVKKPEGFAPELSRVGSKPLVEIAFAAGVPHTLPDYIADKIRNPRAFAPTLKMPRFRITEAQIDVLTTALLALTERAQTQSIAFRFVSTPPAKPLGKAAQTINDLRCFSCHPNKGQEGYVARDLTWEGSVVREDWLEDFLRNPTRCGSRAYGAHPIPTLSSGTAQPPATAATRIVASP
jgi:cbb3-type cytochrome oxidase cytochrome c subunit